MVKKLTRLSRNEEPERHIRAILNDSIFPSDVFCAGVRRNIRLIVKHTEQLTTYAISVVVSIVVFCKCFWNTKLWNLYNFHNDFTNYF